MTLDEVIKHCEEKAKEIRWQALKEKMDIEDVADCEECAEEHEQLAEWLKDYKRLLEERPRRGKWIYKGLSVSGLHRNLCPICKQDVISDRTNYCGNCGADMRER